MLREVAPLRDAAVHGLVVVVVVREGPQCTRPVEDVDLRGAVW